MGASADNEIPVPPPQASTEVHYRELYPSTFIEPRNYIKFSDTVEETLSSLYDMTCEDEDFLKAYNSKKPADAQLSENDFERIMEIFEETAAEQAPFAAVDNTVVTYEAMHQSMIHLVPPKTQTHAKAVYDHWRSRRQANGNSALRPSLKFETHQDHDDLDPYVCFRRREVRQTRKTRARDVQIADRLKRLRRELEDARQLVIFSYQRELLKREMLNNEMRLFEQRAKLKQTKVRLNIKDHDDDLFNTRPQKRAKGADSQAVPRGIPHDQLRMQARSAEAMDLALLSDWKAEKETELRDDIENKVQNHRRWNQNFVDVTREPLPPVRGENPTHSFRPAKTTYLMTPPASASGSTEDEKMPDAEPTIMHAPVLVRGLTPEDSDSVTEYRRRIGRNGRLWIDRRGLKNPPLESSALQSDRFKYDQDDSDGEQPVCRVDPNSTNALKFRSTIPPSMYVFGRTRQAPDPSAVAQVANPHRPALPLTQQQFHQTHPQPQPQPQPPKQLQGTPKASTTGTSGSQPG